MKDTDRVSSNVKYEQLNERSRMYTAQLWQIPGLYLALAAWVTDKAEFFASSEKAYLAFPMAVVSAIVWVYVSQLKFLERRAVRQMQVLEGIPLSTGATVWFFSYIWYVRLLLIAATFAFYWLGIRSVLKDDSCICVFVTGGAVVIAVCYSFLIFYDHKRTGDLFTAIRAQSPRQ